MKKILVTILFSLILLPSLVLATGPDIGIGSANKIAQKAGYESANQYTLSETVGKYIKVALSMVGTIFLALTIYAGYLWMTASGNEENVTKAKDILQMATIGLIITLASYSITVFVVGKVGGGTQAPTTPVDSASAPSCGTGSYWDDFTCWWQGFSDQASTSPWGATE
ncbi:MAG: hypothetical protein ACD_72C00390G0004 [uncultured bacterium]|nr:MAG: hypothetical protein ACD_72C00390G0004 [uncultured bacterium]